MAWRQREAKDMRESAMSICGRCDGGGGLGAIVVVVVVIAAR